MRSALNPVGPGPVELVRVADSALQRIGELAGESADGLETGGILLGFDTPDGVLISVAGNAGPDALREDCRFIRDTAHAQVLADAVFDETGAVWVGEWHTHPVSGPVPSQLDLRSYATILVDPALAFSRFLSMIVVPQPDGSWVPPVAVGWMLTAPRDDIVECRSTAIEVVAY